MQQFLILESRLVDNRIAVTLSMMKKGLSLYIKNCKLQVQEEALYRQAIQP